MNRTKRSVVESEIAELEMRLDILKEIHYGILDDLWDARRKLEELEGELVASDVWVRMD